MLDWKITPGLTMAYADKSRPETDSQELMMNYPSPKDKATPLLATALTGAADKGLKMKTVITNGGRLIKKYSISGTYWFT